jgi:hypothetical protein
MADDKTWIEFVSRLNALTQDRKLLWTQSAAPDALNRGQRVAFVFLTEASNKRLRLYKRTVENALAAALANTPITTTILEILNDDGSVAWVVPVRQGLEDLYASVQFQISGVDEFVKNVIAGHV